MQYMRCTISRFFYIVVSLDNCQLLFSFTACSLCLLLLSGWIDCNIFNLAKRLLALTDVFLQFRKRSPTFGGDTPIFGGIAPTFGEITLNSGAEIENLPRGQRSSAIRSTRLNLLPKTKCAITTIKQPKEVSLLCYSSTW